MKNFLTTAELAKLRGCSDRYIRQQIQNGDIVAVPSDESANNRLEYLIPLSELSEHESWVYQNQQRAAEGAPPLPKPKPEKPRKSLEDFSAEDREEIAKWINILDKWQLIRNNGMKKSDIDTLFCSMIKVDYPDISVSPAILYRKYKAYKNGDFSGLIDNRGGSSKGTSSVPEILGNAFLYFFLDERRLPISRCYVLLKEWVQDFYPEMYSEIPSERTFRRLADSLPEAVVALCRFGEKAMKDKYIPYVERLYEDIEANDVWIADNHTFDFITIGENGRQHRMYLTAFTDAKSGVMVGWNLTDNPSSQSTLLALRHAILRFGVPKSVYFDNGSEFLVSDIGGRGHRKKKNWNNKELAPTILQSLGIEMHNALVRNAKAKPIERTFGTVKNHISRVIETFCGGTILERPESLKWKLKNGIIPEDIQIIDAFSTLIDGDYNVSEYGGKERRYKGKSRLDVWNESIQNTKFRMAPEEDLNILLARVSLPQKITRNGVYITFANEKLWYRAEDTVLQIGRKVYVRYDPSNIATARLYDFETDKYLATWKLGDDMIIPYITNEPEQIATAERARRAAEKAVKEYSKGLTSGLAAEQKIDFLVAALNKAERGMEKFSIKKPTSFTPVVSDKLKEDNPILEGVDEIRIDIDLDRMNANALRRRNAKQ